MPVGIEDNHGWTPLHYASSNGHIEVVEALLHYGSPILPDEKGNTPIDIAVESSEFKVIFYSVRILLNLISYAKITILTMLALN